MDQTVIGPGNPGECFVCMAESWRPYGRRVEQFGRGERDSIIIAGLGHSAEERDVGQKQQGGPLGERGEAHASLRFSKQGPVTNWQSMRPIFVRNRGISAAVVKSLGKSVLSYR